VEVSKIKTNAKLNEDKCKEKSTKAKKYLEEIVDVDDNTIISIPVVGSVVQGLVTGINYKDSAILMCDRNDFSQASKIVLGTAAVAAGGIGGALTAMIYMPAGPYYWFKAISAHFDKKNYKVLNEQFAKIALQMGRVETHLGEITSALGDIENHLKYSLKAGTNVIDAKDKKKRKKIVKRVIEHSTNLIASCDKYEDITKKKCI